MSNPDLPSAQPTKEEILTVLFRAEQLYNWLTNDREYKPLRFMGMLHRFKVKAETDPSINLLEEVQQFIADESPGLDVCAATDKAYEKSAMFLEIVDAISERTIGDVALVLETENYGQIESQFQDHVRTKLGKILKLKTERAKPNIFATRAPRGVKTIRNDEKR